MDMEEVKEVVKRKVDVLGCQRWLVFFFHFSRCVFE